VGTGDAITVVVASVRPGDGGTPYTRIGDWAAWLAIAITIASAGLLILRRKRPTSDDSAVAIPSTEPVSVDA
jgi:apolipoprotein N-acyltransferase